MKHQEHIVCIKSSQVDHREHGVVSYELSLGDVMLGQRKMLEADSDFRQVLPVSVFTHHGKIWAYERTNNSGEVRLKNRTSICVGGHWDLQDMVIHGGIIDMDASLEKAISRELEEEIKLTSSIVSTQKLPAHICADDTEVDRVHLGMVWIHELDGEGIESAEDKLKGIGFLSPDELLSDDYNTEVWAKIICNILKGEKAI